MADFHGSIKHWRDSGELERKFYCLQISEFESKMAIRDYFPTNSTYAYFSRKWR